MSQRKIKKIRAEEKIAQKAS
ncbi:MAG: hypothetical protein US68_C0030G0011, partial [Candidatus Shapirobacteria bacterium GW2011_GWE1_38_10]